MFAPARHFLGPLIEPSAEKASQVVYGSVGTSPHLNPGADLERTHRDWASTTTPFLGSAGIAGRWK
jgi:hypothetical protein